MKKTDTFSHYREGKSQMQRFLAELDPENIELHDFDLFDWLLFANNFAKHVNFFAKDDNTAPQGNWGNFFLGDDTNTIPRRESVEYKSLKKSVTELISQFEQNSNLTPHLTLFVCFLKLLDFSKKAFNNLTKRHLDFYYNEILQIQKNDAQPDKAYVIFELAKKAIQERIPEGTLLDGSKDANGKKRVYKTNEEFIANQAKVVEIKSFLNDDEKQELKMAHVANSADGLGDKLPEESNYWWPFGYNSDEASADKSIYKNLPNARLGFAVASSLFNLKEGERTVAVTIDFNQNSGTKLNRLTDDEIKKSIKVLCSGEEEWLSDIELTCKKSDTQLKLSFTLPRDFPAVVKYDKKILLENFNTEFAVVRFILEGETSYNLYEALSEKTVKNVHVEVDVRGVKTINIENDHGELNSEKPYYPFTAQPIKGSNFFINCPEMFSKNWKNASITINWKNAPESFTDLYSAYIIQPNENITLSAFNKLKNKSIVTNDSYFKADSALLEKDGWSIKSRDINIFQKIDGNYKTQFTINNTSDKSARNTSIKLTLKQSLLQDVYPKLYTLVLSSSSEKDSKAIPNEPYALIAEDIELNYQARETLYSQLNKNANGTPVRVNDIEVYHEDAFGQYEKDAETLTIVPVHQIGGELYIGLEATPSMNVNLLIQMLEGSENPLAKTFENKEFIQWDILSHNNWVDLSSHILKNETRKFLESGIISFKIPKNINTNHTRLTDGLVWLRAKSKRSYDAVCKIQGIYTQAVLATFQNQDNELSHLSNGLEAKSISKLITRVPQIKSVSQPYNSFDGHYQETDGEFYRRVSERLRHKNRAITQWDYEHLILQKFSDVYKVKCLNHTSEKSYMAPGHVTLMVVPNLRNKNAFDIYQPRVSRSSLVKIQDYINELNTMHVSAQVINPNYREAKIEVEVKFFEKYDETFYSKQLDEDIKKYISPWAFTENKDIDFNIKLNVNQLINYLEELHYVDYITGINILVDNVLQKQTLIEVDPKSILVSAKEHKVTISNQVCI